MMLRIMRMMRITMILSEMHSPSSSYYCHTHNNDIPVEGATTRIKNPKAGNATDAIKSFNFDYSYWSKEVSGSTEPFAFLTSTPKDEKKRIMLQVAGQHTYAFLCIFNIHGPRRHGNGYWCIPMPPLESSICRLLLFQRGLVVNSPSWQDHIHDFTAQNMSNQLFQWHVGSIQ